MGSLLPNQTQVNASVSFYGSGGGGGGGGSGAFSTVTTSSIALGPSGLITSEGALNFELTPGNGAMSLLSTVSALDGTTPATDLVITSPGLTKQIFIGVPEDGKAFISTSATSINYLNPIPHNYAGGSISGLSTLSVSSISGAIAGLQPTATLSANNLVTYIKGGSDAVLFSLPSQAAQHSYRIEFPVKVQGWNATDGNTNSYAPAPEDWLSIYPQGNVVGSPAPVFTTLQMAQVSSINNDWEGVITGVWKTTATGAEQIVAATAPTVGYSTSVEIGSFGYITDLGAI